MHALKLVEVVPQSKDQVHENPSKYMNLVSSHS